MADLQKKLVDNDAWTARVSCPVWMRVVQGRVVAPELEDKLGSMAPERNGLTSEEAKKRMAEYGPNEIPTIENLGNEVIPGLCFS